MTASAFQVLCQLADRSHSSAQQLPAQVDVVPRWNGVGFSLLGFNFVVSVGDFSEMLEVPNYTRLPGVVNWVKGVANVRGRLLPVFDLASYLGGKITGNKKQQRLLVVDKPEIYAGFWVDQVFGIQHFTQDSHEKLSSTPLPEKVEPFVDGSFVESEQEWHVFKPLKLLDKSSFQDVSARPS